MVTDQREAFEKWVQSLPYCIGGEEGCDGDLVGEEHEENCPMSKVPDSRGRYSAATYYGCWQAGQDAAHESDAQLADKAAEALAEAHGGAEMRELAARIRARKKG